MTDQIVYNHDWHVSSTFSDGSATVREIVAAAEALGVDSLCIVDQARRSSPWVRDLADACRAADAGAEVDVRCGIEVEILDTNGTVELPPFASQTDYLFLASYRLPTPYGLLEPEIARGQIQAGELFPAQAVEWLVRAYVCASRRPGAIILAHPFSLLPQLGISPECVHASYARWLAGALRENETGVEVSEFWRAPSAHIVDSLVTAGVQVLPGSGARSLQALGRGGWYREVIAELSSLARAA